MHLGEEQSVAKLSDQGFDEVVLATGIIPRKLDIPGIEHEKVLSYLDILRDNKEAGNKVAIIGAGGIGFDVAEFITEEHSLSTDADAWLKAWGIDKEYVNRGALTESAHPPSEKEVFLLQRKSTKVGKGLGKTTGWIHRASLQSKNVQMIPGVSYDKIDDDGLHITVEDTQRVLDVDSIIVCAGQEPNKALYNELVDAGIKCRIIGGADVAAELDAKRAIRQGAELAALI